MDQTRPADPTVIVLTALPAEMKAVLSHVDDATPQMVGPILCEIGRFIASNGLTWRVAAAELGPGNVDTATAVAATSESLRPEVVLFVGIAGALKGDVGIGDVVAGNAVAWTERGKAIEGGYLPRIQTVSLSYPLSQWARRVAREGRWKDRLPSERINARAVIGQIASSEKVIAAEEERAELQRTFSDAIAVENEGFGMARAAETYSAGEAGVIRGISDAADSKKSDDAQQLAAEAAAAFSFELLDAYSSVQATSVAPRVTPLQAEESVADQSGVSSDDVERLASDLITDIDMIDDDRGQVEELAQAVARQYDEDFLGSLIGHISAALQAETGALVERRLRWLGRQLLRSASAHLQKLELDNLAKSAPRGMALLLTDPAVWSLSSVNARRRCLTALIGPSDNPHQPSDQAIRMISPLLSAGAVNENEAARIRASFDLASLYQLIANGMTLDTLVPRILEDLDSGSFSRQNDAARFLYGLPPEQANKQLSPSMDIAIGAKLVEAATGAFHSFGAAEALALPYISSWPRSRIVGGIWASLTYIDGQELRPSASEHLPKLIAAAAGRDELEIVLANVRDLLTSSLERVRPSEAREAGEGIERLAERYQSDDQVALRSFAEWLQSWRGV